MTLARNEVKNATDCWVPVLFTRLVDGRLWRKGSFTRNSGGQSGMDAVIAQLKLKKCVPVLGSGILESAVGVPNDMARRWAEAEEYPLLTGDFDNFPRIAQYLAATQSPIALRVKFVEDWSAELKRRWPAMKEVSQKPDEEPQVYLMRLLEAAWPVMKK